MEDNAMKKVYMKPAMRTVKLRHQHIICTSPGGYDSKTLGSYRGGDDTVTDDDEGTLF